MDILTPEQRHRNMSRIRSKNTKIEIILRKALWHQGIRYRKNYDKLIGHPDIVLTKYKIAIFCDSEFWHGYNWENTQNDIKSNREFWIKKIERNIKRDEIVNSELKNAGWLVLRFWGKDIVKYTDRCVEIIINAIKMKFIIN